MTKAEKFMDDNNKQLLKAIFIVYNREVKKKLTGEYLGVFTGNGRNTTLAIIDNGKVYFGTYEDYMRAYETGQWAGVKEDQISKKAYMLKFKGRKNNRWSGDKKHRPYLKDTIEDPAVQMEILKRFMEMVK